MAKPKIQYLEQTRNTYRYVRRIPKQLLESNLLEHPFFQHFRRSGNFLRLSLNTSSLTEAKHLRDDINVRWHSVLTGDYGKHETYTTVFDSLKNATGEDIRHIFNQSYQQLETAKRTNPDGSFSYPQDMLAKHTAIADSLAEHDSNVIANKALRTKNPYSKSFHVFVKEFIEDKKREGKDERTLKDYERSAKAFESFFRSQFRDADVDIKQVDKSLTYDFEPYLIDTYNASPTTIKKKYITNLSALWEYAIKKGIVDINPFRNLGVRTKHVTKSYVPYEKGQLEKHIQALKPEHRLAFVIGYYTGVRISELMSLNANSIVTKEAKDGTLIKCFSLLPEQDGKTVNATRIIPIHSALEPLLEDFNGFEHTESALDKDRRKTCIELFGKETCNKRLVFHSLRHTFTTTLINELDGNENLVNWLTGHTKTGSSAFQTYFHGYGIERLKETIEKIPYLYYL